METLKKNIILLGDGATGKTSLVRRFVTDQFSDKYMTTLGSKVTKKDIYITFMGEQRHMILLIWDILGQRGYKYTQALSFGGIEGALLVADITRKSTLDSLKEYWIPSLISVTGALPMIFLGNKSDMQSQAEFGEKELEEYALGYDPCELRKQTFITNSKDGINVEAAFRELAETMMRNTEKARLTYSQYIIDKTEINEIRDVADHIIADFCNQFGGAENAGPIIERQIVEVGLDIENPTKKELVELVNALAGIEEKFKPEKVVNLNRTKRLYLVNLF
jgi:small GTP-binding protein